MGKTVARRKTTPNPSGMLLIQYLTHKKAESDAKKAAEKVKGELKEVTEKYHTEDPEKGHHIHTLPEALDFLGQKFTGFMNQRKVSQVFHEDRAEALCQEKGFDLEDYTTRYVDQDKIVRLYADDKITQEEFDSLSEEVETWAFVPVKE
jgi:hypothetical protein